MSEAIELFECAPIRNTRLTRRACGQRHERAIEEAGHKRQGVAHLGDAKTCSECPIGAAHARGETPERWADGAPIVVLQRTAPEPGRSRWTSASDDAPRSEERPDPPASPPAGGDRRAPRAAVPEPEPELEEEPVSKNPGGRPPTLLTHDGRTLTFVQWAETPEVQALGLGADALRMRLRKGWTVERALTTPKTDRATTATRVTAHKLDAAFDHEAKEPIKPGPKPKPKRRPRSKAKTPTLDAIAEKHAREARPRGRLEEALALVRLEIEALEQRAAELRQGANVLAGHAGLAQPYPEAGTS